MLNKSLTKMLLCGIVKMLINCDVKGVNLMDEIYKMHADVCKTLANPVRLMIINTLRTKRLCASDLIRKIKTNKVILSQHMATLTDKGVVNAERSGKNVFYQLSDPQIIKACDIMRNVLVKNLERKRELLRRINGKVK